MLLQRRTYVQPRVRQRFRPEATTRHSQRRSEPTVHNWELCIMAGSRSCPRRQERVLGVECRNALRFSDLHQRPADGAGRTSRRRLLLLGLHLVRAVREDLRADEDLVRGKRHVVEIAHHVHFDDKFRSNRDGEGFDAKGHEAAVGVERFGRAVALCVTVSWTMRNPGRLRACSSAAATSFRPMPWPR